MEYRIMNEGDRPAIVKLWGGVFGDTPDFVNRCIDELAGKENVFVAEDFGRLAAQLLAVPCKAGGQNGVYLYALATSEDYRKAGVMTALMQFAEKTAAENGAKFAALVPADTQLFGYYEKRGYAKTASVRRLGTTLFGRRSHEAKFLPLTPEALNALRAKFADVPCIMFSGVQMQILLDDLMQTGGLLVQTPAGYAVVKKHGAKLLVQELFCNTEEDAKKLVAAAVAHTHCIAASVTLAENSPLFKGAGHIVPFGMVKSLVSGAPPPSLYIRFGGG